MNRLTEILIVVWLLAMSSCEVNELPEDDVSDPVYFTEGTIDGESFNIEVGPDNVYVESESDLVDDEVPLFSVYINGDECEECAGSLAFEISGGQDYTEGLEFNELIFEGNYTVTSGEEEVSSLEINWDPSSSLSSLLLDGIEFDEEIPLIDLPEGPHIIELSQFEEDELLACFYAAEFVVSETEGVCFEQTEIEIEDDILSIFINEEMEDQVESVILSIGEELITLSPDEELTYQLDGSLPLFQMSVSITYHENSCLLHEEFGILDFEFGNDWCVPELTIDNNYEPSEPDPLTVHISFINEEGDHYISDSIFQDNWFEITGIEVNSESSQLVFDITFSCQVQLVNTENDSDVIDMELINAVIPLVFD